jgi:hypothetical protein
VSQHGHNLRAEGRGLSVLRIAIRMPRRDGDRRSNTNGFGHQVMQEPHPLGYHLAAEIIDADCVAAEPGKVGDKTKPDRVVADAEDDGDGRCCGFGRERGFVVAAPSRNSGRPAPCSCQGICARTEGGNEDKATGHGYILHELNLRIGIREVGMADESGHDAPAATMRAWKPNRTASPPLNPTATPNSRTRSGNGSPRLEK